MRAGRISIWADTHIRPRDATKAIVILAGMMGTLAITENWIQSGRSIRQPITTELRFTSYVRRWLHPRIAHRFRSSPTLSGRHRSWLA